MGGSWEMNIYKGGSRKFNSQNNCNMSNENTRLTEQFNVTSGTKILTETWFPKNYMNGFEKLVYYTDDSHEFCPKRMTRLNKLTTY